MTMHTNNSTNSSAQQSKNDKGPYLLSFSRWIMCCINMTMTVLCFHCTHVCVCAILTVFVTCFPLKSIRERCFELYIHGLSAMSFSTALFHHHLCHIVIICRHFASPAVPISTFDATAANAFTPLLSFFPFVLSFYFDIRFHNLYYSAR